MNYYFVITESCSYHCPFCIRGDKNQSLMSFEKFKRVCERDNFIKDTIIVTGGEPTLHPSLFQFLDVAAKKCKTVVLCSNGVKPIDFQSDNFIVQLSLDGTKDIHNKIRSPKAFEDFLHSYNFYKRKNVKVIISTTVCSTNIDDIINMLMLIEKLEPYYWKVNLDQSDWENSSGVGIDRWNKLVDELVGKSRIRLSIKKQFPIKEIEVLDIKPINKKYLNCGCCTEKVYIYPDFSVFPCTCLKDFCLGNLFEEPMNQILENDKACQFINYRPYKAKECLECKYLPICNGGCIGSAYKKNGSLGFRDPRCPIEVKK